MRLDKNDILSINAFCVNSKEYSYMTNLVRRQTSFLIHIGGRSIYHLFHQLCHNLSPQNCWVDHCSSSCRWCRSWMYLIVSSSMYPHTVDRNIQSRLFSHFY